MSGANLVPPASSSPFSIPRRFRVQTPLSAASQHTLHLYPDPRQACASRRLRPVEGTARGRQTGCVRRPSGRTDAQSPNITPGRSLKRRAGRGINRSENPTRKETTPRAREPNPWGRINDARRKSTKQIHSFPSPCKLVTRNHIFAIHVFLFFPQHLGL